jgi:hypothetical protein
MKCVKLFSVLLATLVIANAGWTQTTSTLLTASSSSSSSAPASSGPPPAPSVALAGSSLKITINWRGRAEAWDWFSTPTTDGHYGFGASLLRVGIGQDLRNLEWQFEFAQPSLMNLPAHAVAPGPQGQLGLGATYYIANGKEQNVAWIFPKQGYLRFKWTTGDDNPTSLKLGRMEFIEGIEHTPKDETLAILKRERVAQRLIGNFGFSDVQRSFDGLHFVFDTKNSNTTFFAGRPTQGVFDTDGLRELNVDVLYGAHTHAFGGKKAPGEVRGFVLYYNDLRHALKTDNRNAIARTADKQNIQITTVGGHFLETVPTSVGTADFLVWGAVQTGDWGRLAQRASAVSLEAGFQPKWPLLKPWLRIGHFYGSGDGNPTDGRHETFFQVLPTPRTYARFPFYDLMNNTDDFAQLWIRPHPRIAFRTEFHNLRLSDPHDLWYLGGGAFQQGTFGYTGRPSGNHRALANVVDLSADYKVSKDWSVTAYAAHAQGQSVISALFPAHNNANLYYLELNYKMGIAIGSK